MGNPHSFKELGVFLFKLIMGNRRLFRNLYNKNSNTYAKLIHDNVTFPLIPQKYHKYEGSLLAKKLIRTLQVKFQNLAGDTPEKFINFKIKFLKYYDIAPWTASNPVIDV